LRQREVDEKAADAHVDVGLRQAAASNEFEEHELKLAAGPADEARVVADRQVGDLGGPDRITELARLNHAP
jgi:hypothetical protein